MIFNSYSFNLRKIIILSSSSKDTYKIVIIPSSSSKDTYKIGYPNLYTFFYIYFNYTYRLLIIFISSIPIPYTQ